MSFMANSISRIVSKAFNCKSRFFSLDANSSTLNTAYLSYGVISRVKFQAEKKSTDPNVGSISSARNTFAVSSLGSIFAKPLLSCDLLA